MRSVNRKRTWIGNRRLFGGPDAGGAALAPGEADSEAPPVVNESDGAIAPPPHFNGDPTQRLLTALGRFQRQVARAEGGAPQAQWVDECMNQLITGIELAVVQEWNNVMQALTDTARVLASYESADRAGECVPFLEDAYEILCLMVGDLIVDNVRSGVMTKWRERYNEAVGDLAREGIPLMEDEEEAPSQPVSRPVAASAALGEEAETEEFEEMDSTEELESDELPEEEADGPLESTLNTEHESDSEPDTPFADPLSATELAVHPGERESEEELDLPSLEDALGPAETDYAREEQDETEAPDLREETVAEEPAPAADEDDGLGWLDEEPAQAAAPPRDHTEAAAEQPDLFSGLEFAEEAAPDSNGPSRDPRPASAEPAQSRQEVTPQVDLAAQGDASRSAEHLLNTAQEALSLGNVADAKLLALELAAKMARMEADRSAARVRECESRLEGNRRAIAEAEDGVLRTEKDVADADTRVAGREQEHRAHRERLESLSGEMETVSARIAELEARIRELEDIRAQELRTQEEIRGRYEEALDVESRIQTEIESLNESAQQVQEGLETARERVVRLQQERQVREKELEEARRRHEQRRRSVEEIDRTIDSVRTLLDSLGSDEEDGTGEASGSDGR